MEKPCINHSEIPATHIVVLPAQFKNNMGEYKETVYMCTPCSERMNKIGFKPELIKE